MLGFPGFSSLSEDRRSRLNTIVASIVELELNASVIQKAVELRQQRKMRLGDAVIAATALVHKMPLVTRNVDDFKHIPDLTLINPFTDS